MRITGIAPGAGYRERWMAKDKEFTLTKPDM
jgi:hypothetical protein